MFLLDTAAPDFKAETTKGNIGFHDYTGTSWVILLAYPADFGAVATTELVILAKLQKTFLDRNVKLLAMSPGTLKTHKRWVKDVEEISGAAVGFPIIVDEDRTISYMYRTIDNDDLEGDINVNALRTRTAFIISPDNRFRMIFNYPAAVGMNIAELLRSIECLKVAREIDGVRTPANWSNGGDVIFRPDVSDEIANRLITGSPIIKLKRYLRFAKFQKGDWTIPHLVFYEGRLKASTLDTKAGVLQVQTGGEMALRSE